MNPLNDQRGTSPVRKNPAPNSDFAVVGQPDPDIRLPPAWCIVANIVGQHAFGPGGEQSYAGTRKLRAGSKVYVIGSFRGMGSETVTVVGRLRYDNRFVTIHIASKYLRNHRVRLAYSRYVILAAQRQSGKWDCSTQSARDDMENLADVIVSYAGLARVKIKDGPLTGQRRTFPVEDIPNHLLESDLDGNQVEYRLQTRPHGLWYSLQ